MANTEVENRIKEVRTHFKLTRAQFGDSLGVTESVISNIELHRNKTDITTKKSFIDLICSHYSVDKNWLLTGKGEMFMPRKQNDAISILQHQNRFEFASDMGVNYKKETTFRIKDDYNLTDEAASLIEGIINLSANEQKELYVLFNKIIKMQELPEENNKYEIKIKNKTYELPFYEYPVAAGTGNPYDNLPQTAIVVEDEIAKDADFALPVSGDSMEPTYYDGDIVLIKRTEDLEIGEIGIFLHDGNEFIKELGDGILISHNPNYDPIPLSENDTIQGKVLGKIKIK